ncbi:thioredoxin family protein [Pontibacterium sp.]|uniref:thioredoxin family protein n=1 Tax=Pontibacterium sp. TaxID=2036026 RepID=UPI003566C12F
MSIDQNLVLVEVLTASGCGRCQKARSLAQETVAELNNARIQYREINVVEEIDYAVQLGVLSTPAIALNGELVFPAPPSKAKLRLAILERLEGA